MAGNKIAAKLTKVMAACHYVQKCGKNQFHNYKYAMAADVLEKVNNSLVENGLAAIVTPELVEFKDVTTKKGDTERLATVKTTITLVDYESGETLQLVGLGSGQDAGDKAVMKAQTASIKYAWMLSLQISTGDDPEADETVDERTSGQSPKPAGTVQNQTARTAVKTTAKATTKTKVTTAAPGQEPIKTDSKPVLSAAQIKRFYTIVGASGASESIIKMIINDVLRDKMCVALETGKIMWQYVPRGSYDDLCNLFESGGWQDYFARMMDCDGPQGPDGGGAQDLRDVG
jgi:hypothetical protein